MKSDNVLLHWLLQPIEDDVRGWWDITDAMILCAHFADEKTEAQKGHTIILGLYRTGPSAQIFRLYVQCWYMQREEFWTQNISEQTFSLIIWKMDVKIAELKML